MKTKNLLFIGVILLNGITFSQTKIIAHKSHSGNMSSINLSSGDNFGYNPREEELYRIDSIIRISDTSVIQVSKMGRDTVCHNPYFNDTSVSLETLKYMYSPDIKFVGFEKNPVQNSEEPNEKRINENGIHWLMGLFLTLGIAFSYIQTELYKKSPSGKR